MAKSGKINGSPVANGSSVSHLYAYWADWQLNSSSVDKNTSNITVWLRLQRIDGSNAGAYALDVKPSVSLSVGGSAKTPSIEYIDTRNQVVCTFATWTGDVEHNADGTLNCPISASFTHYGSSTLTDGSLSGNATLDTIPRATTFDSLTCSSEYFTGTITYKYTPKAATLYNRCTIALNMNGTYTAVSNIKLGKKSASQQTGTEVLSADELYNICSTLGSATKGWLRFTFRTYSDPGYSNQIGSAVYKELELSVPDTTFDSLTCPNSYFTDTMTYKYTPKAATLYNQCYITLNMSGTHVAVKTINLGTKAASQQIATVTLTGSELAIICKKLTSTGSGKLRFTFRTYVDSSYSKQIGASQHKELELSVPSPSLDPLTCSTDNFEGTLTYKYTPVSSVLYNRCVIALKVSGTLTTVKTINIGAKAASQQTATVALSDSELTTIFSKLTSAISGVLRFTFSSYAESGYTTQVGSARHQEITLNIPDTTLDELTCATNYLTGEMTYKYTPKTTVLYNRCRITLKVDGTFTEVKTIKLGKTAASQQTETVTLSDSELATIFRKLASADAKSGVLRFAFSTFSESGYSKQVGSTSHKEITLDIPNTTLDSLTCATSYFTGVMTYKYTPKTTALYNRCTITLNVDGTQIALETINLDKKPASQQTSTHTLDGTALETVYNKLPSTTKGVLRFTLRMYSDSGYENQVGTASHKEMTLTIPNNANTKPTVTIKELSPVSTPDLPSAFSGLYIKGKTKVKATLSTKGQFSASIKSSSVKVQGVSYDSDDKYTSDYLSSAGSTTVYAYATDSRGFTGNTSQRITVIDYSKPKILNVEAFRCDNGGNAAAKGTYLKIKAKRSYSKVVADGEQKNFCIIQYRWKASNASSYSSWTTILAKTASGDTVTTSALLSGALDTKTTYVVQVRAYDDFGEYATVDVGIPTESVYMHRTKNAMALGKYVEGENVLDVAWDAHFRGDVLIGDSGMTLREYILSVISEGG